MSPVQAIQAAAKSSRHSLRAWIIGLGWLGFALWALEVASTYFRIEIVDSTNLRTTFHIVQVGLGWLWPAALALHFRALVAWPTLRYILMGATFFLVVPAFAFSLLFLAFYWISHDAIWQDEQVLYTKAADSGIRVVAQTRYDGFATSEIQYRTVQLTPLLGLWQRAEPVDTATFNSAGWQRVQQ